MADSTARLSHGWQPDRIQEEAHRRDRWAVGRFGLSLILALAWVVFSIWLSLPWLSDLGGLTHPLAALFVLAFVAYVPGFMNAFLMASLVLRPEALRRTPEQWPALSILIAAYNEEALIGETLRSIAALDYPGALQIMVLDDGSTDGTAAAVRDAEALFAGSSGRDLLLVSEKQNRGKARVLNDGLALAAHDLVVTIDADTLLEKGCLVALVELLLERSNLCSLGLFLQLGHLGLFLCNLCLALLVLDAELVDVLALSLAFELLNLGGGLGAGLGLLGGGLGGGLVGLGAGLVSLGLCLGGGLFGLGLFLLRHLVADAVRADGIVALIVRVKRVVSTRGARRVRVGACGRVRVLEGIDPVGVAGTIVVTPELVDVLGLGNGRRGGTVKGAELCLMKVANGDREVLGLGVGQA